MTASPTFSIVIPAYNEEERLGPTLDRVLAFARGNGWRAEIIVVNDGSRDRTAEIVRSYERNTGIVRLLENPGNRGKGYSVRHGVLNATGEFILFTDADMSSPIEEAPKLLQALAGGADIAIGSRWARSELQTRRQSLARQFLGRVFNLLLRLLLRLDFKDTQCGFKAFRLDVCRPILEEARINGFAFDVELLFLAHCAGLRIQEIPVRWNHAEGSKVSFFKDSLRMLREVLALRTKHAVP